MKSMSLSAGLFLPRKKTKQNVYLNNKNLFCVNLVQYSAAKNEIRCHYKNMT